MEEPQPNCSSNTLLLPGACANLNKLMIMIPILFIILGGFLAGR